MGNELLKRGVHCIDRFMRKLLDKVADREAFLDIMMEGRIVIILSKHGFSQIHVEYSDAGPDLKASYNRRTIYFEITKRRPRDEDKVLLQSKGPIWVSPQKTETTLGKIQE